MAHPTKQLQDLLDRFEQTVDGCEHELRSDFALIILQRLAELKWRQADLARQLGKPESFVSRLVHADANCEFSTLASVLHVLGLRCRLTTEPLKATGSHGELVSELGFNYEEEAVATYEFGKFEATLSIPGTVDETETTATSGELSRER